MATVPTIQSGSITPNLIQVGPGMLWYDVTCPGDGQILQVSGQGSGVNDQRLFGPLPYTLSGTFAGSTIGDSTIAYKPQFLDIMIEQSPTKVEKVLTAEETRISFSVAEMTAENIKASVPIATLSTSADPMAFTTQVRHIVKAGGLRLVEPTTVAFIAANRRISQTGTNIFSYVFCAYAAVASEGFDAPFSRGKESVWRAVWDCIANPGRTLGDQVWQFVVRQSS